MRAAPAERSHRHLIEFTAHLCSGDGRQKMSLLAREASSRKARVSSLSNTVFLVLTQVDSGFPPRRHSRGSAQDPFCEVWEDIMLVLIFQNNHPAGRRRWKVPFKVNASRRKIEVVRLFTLPIPTLA